MSASPLNLVDSSGWIEFFTDGPNAGTFARPLAVASLNEPEQPGRIQIVELLCGSADQIAVWCAAIQPLPRSKEVLPQPVV